MIDYAKNRANAEAFAAEFDDPKPAVVQAGDAFQVAAWDSARAIGYTGVFFGEGAFKAYLEITSPADPATAARAIKAALER